MTDPRVHVPVSLPTREQIAEALWREYRGGPYADWSALTESDKDEWRAGADAVLALLSQPTPTADPLHEYEEGRFGDDGICHARFKYGPQTRCLLPRSAHVIAEPPRIEDMAPGTTFLSTVDQHNTTALRFMRTSTGGAVDQDGTLWPLNAFDPSTIRDVTPQKEDR